MRKVQSLLLMFVRAIAVVDVVYSFVPMVVYLFDIQFVADQVDIPKLFNFWVKVGVHQRHLVIVVKKEVLVHSLILALVIDELERLLLNL